MELSNVVEFVTDVQFTTVQDGTKSFTKVKGIAKRADHINKNKRFYPAATLTKAVGKAQDTVKAGGLIGLMDHPTMFEGSKGSPSKTAIKWTDIKMDGVNVVTEGIIVDTAAGRDLQALVDAEVRIELSTNVRGKVRYVKASELDKNYEQRDTFVQVFDELDFQTIDVVNGAADEYASLSLDSVREGIKSMTLEELKKDNPELYKQLLQDAAAEAPAKAAAPDDKILDEIVKLRQELDAEKTKRAELERIGLVDAALAEAKLPALGKVSDIDLDARLRARLENAAKTAQDATAAKTAIADIIAEQRALLGAGGDPKQVKDQAGGVRLGDNSKKTEKPSGDRSTVNSARSTFGL